MPPQGSWGGSTEFGAGGTGFGDRRYGVGDRRVCPLSPRPRGPGPAPSYSKVSPGAGLRVCRLQRPPKVGARGVKGGVRSSVAPGTEFGGARYGVGTGLVKLVYYQNVNHILIKLKGLNGGLVRYIGFGVRVLL